MKHPIICYSSDEKLLSAARYCIENDLGWIDHDKKKTPIADIIINLMTTHKQYTFEELLDADPVTMKTLLQTPQLHTIIDNCRMFVHSQNKC